MSTRTGGDWATTLLADRATELATNWTAAANDHPPGNKTEPGRHGPAADGQHEHQDGSDTAGLDTWTEEKNGARDPEKHGKEGNERTNAHTHAYGTSAEETASAKKGACNRPARCD